MAAHYQAGTQRGFPAAQVSGARAAAVIDAINPFTARRLDAGERQMPGRFMRGQAPLEELRDCAKAEGPDGVLFISRAGEVVLLDNDHRASAPYNTVQATFDDDGSDLMGSVYAAVMRGVQGIVQAQLERAEKEKELCPHCVMTTTARALLDSSFNVIYALFEHMIETHELKGKELDEYRDYTKEIFRSLLATGLERLDEYGKDPSRASKLTPDGKLNPDDWGSGFDS